MYHNWRHGFNVAQMMFAMLTSGQMSQQFSDVEVFALLVGSLCHDIDHRGTTNQFQKLLVPLIVLDFGEVSRTA
jgi:dual 3',5'-cyclic-AMP and -GMP phosphodiesterase 11